MLKPVSSIYLEVVWHAVVREDATKDITVVPVVSDTIFPVFNVLRDLPSNGHLTRAKNHRRPLPFEPVSTIQPDRDEISLLFVYQIASFMADQIPLADRYSYYSLHCNFLKEFFKEFFKQFSKCVMYKLILKICFWNRNLFLSREILLFVDSRINRR